MLVAADFAGAVTFGTTGSFCMFMLHPQLQCFDVVVQLDVNVATTTSLILFAHTETLFLFQTGEANLSCVLLVVCILFSLCAWSCTLYGATKRNNRACRVCMVMYSLWCHKERQSSVQGVHGAALFTVPQRETSKCTACAWCYYTLYGVTKRDKQACSVCMVVHSLWCHKERQASVKCVHLPIWWESWIFLHEVPSE